MIPAKYLLSIGLLLVTAAAVAWSWRRPATAPCRDFAQATVLVGEKTMPVALAATASERARGLSGCAQLPPLSGMYFTFGEPRQAEFWMKDMLIPIDIVWILDGKVIGVERNVPPPRAEESDHTLPRYRAPGLINAVLELPAGQADHRTIDVGTPILLQ